MIGTMKEEVESRLAAVEKLLSGVPEEKRQEVLSYTARVKCGALRHTQNVKAWEYVLDIMDNIRGRAARSWCRSNHPVESESTFIRLLQNVSRVEVGPRSSPVSMAPVEWRDGEGTHDWMIRCVCKWAYTVLVEHQGLMFAKHVVDSGDSDLQGHALMASMANRSFRVDEKRNWVEDYKDGENQYENKCSTCGEPFFGHKRRITCKLCSDRRGESEANNIADTRMEELKRGSEHGS